MIYKRLLILTAVLALSISTYAQTPADLTAAREAAKQKNYPQAIQLYGQALKADPANAVAGYEMAFALYNYGRGAEALPVLETAAKNSNSEQLTAGIYALTGAVYEQQKQLPQAIAVYRKGIATMPGSADLYYKLSLAYSRTRQYDEAEQAAISAIGLNAGEASYHRTYALVTFHQNKRVEALLGFCRFLTLEPNTARSAEAFTNLQNILQGGSLKPDPAYKPTTAAKAIAARQNGLIAAALKPFATRRYSSQADLFAAQLTAIIFTAQDLTGSKVLQANLKGFTQLNNAGHMPAFARFISQSTWPESKKWLDANSVKATALTDWLKLIGE